MTENEIFNALQAGGAYSLPTLIKIEHPDSDALLFADALDDITYNGETYHASAFKYTKPQTVGGVLKNGTLEITAIDNSVIDLLDNSDELITVKAIGTINKDATITPIKSFMHKYGTVTINEEMKIIISFSNDDRLDMIFPPTVFDTDNNAGNA